MLEYYLLGIILVPGVLLAALAQHKVNSSFASWSTVLCSCGLTAAELARKVLDDNGLSHINITRVSGHLTDHYNPKKNIIALSDSVYNSQSIASIGVALHEVGHAIQYKNNYLPIKLRNIIIPISNFVSRMLWPMVIIGLLFSFLIIPGSLFGLVMLYVSVSSFALSVLLNLITLPVEYNASRRALKILTDGNYMMEEELSGVREVLNAAALTYVASLVIAILNLLRFVLAFLIRDRD